MSGTFALKIENVNIDVLKESQTTTKCLSYLIDSGITDHKMTALCIKCTNITKHSVNESKVTRINCKTLCNNI